MPMCATEGCESHKKHQSRYCGSCKRRRGIESRLRRGMVCSIADCGEATACQGFCHKHYRRWKKHGDATALKRRANGEGCIMPAGYRTHYINRRHTLEHRMVMASHLGRPLLNSEIVHHRNRNKLDNRVETLAVVDRNTHKLLCEMENIFTLPEARFRELFAMVADQFDFSVRFDRR